MTEAIVDSAPIPVIVHLSGARRGTTQRLRGDTLTIGTDPDVDVHVAHEPAVASHHATLIRQGTTYEIESQPERPVWVNGQPVEHRVLSSGDVLEIGRDGPILRYRLYPPGSKAYKTPTEAFADCVECARHSSANAVGRAATFLTETPRELATQTSRRFRLLTAASLLILIVLFGLLIRSFLRLEQRIEQEEMRVTGIAELLETTEQELSPEDLAQISTSLSSALRRVEALEARSDAPARVVASASRSIVFLQGSYGFIEPDTRRPLRFAGSGPDGSPLRDRRGVPLVGLEGDGPVVEAFFTGTGFVATTDGLVLTNRHVALPWAYDSAALQIANQGLQPIMRRFVGYLPGNESAFDVDLLAASDNADLAALQCRGVTSTVPVLELGSAPPAAGDEVIVLGYPTGIRALLARADAEFVDALSRDPTMDFWSLAARLAAAGHIAPLASRGIVAQVTATTVVYDAETTRGGSGGPVLDLDGKVVAITSAVVPEFGGSNLGVPSSRARALLHHALLARRLPIRLR